jgi:hypothetical protein
MFVYPIHHLNLNHEGHLLSIDNNISNLRSLELYPNSDYHQYH